MKIQENNNLTPCRRHQNFVSIQDIKLQNHISKGGDRGLRTTRRHKEAEKEVEGRRGKGVLGKKKGFQIEALSGIQIPSIVRETDSGYIGSLIPHPEREGRKKKADAIAEAKNLMEMESSEKKMTSETSPSPKPNFEGN
ncbi:hypothetical protein C1H46_016286 [Malus baccata]|uniref:Uncharacterized protein n=1 Tax=Malus baccata TaxID=106549 RepID=A0A540MHI1_MALBA|nr:hypothetical protein C1H46_016286 [Malus baccata]